MSEPPRSRRLVDSVGVSWQVHEVTPSWLSPTLERLQPAAERRQPWLVFDSDEGEKRRLMPVPPGWATCTDFELERWCMRATRVPPAPARRKADR